MDFFSFFFLAALLVPSAAYSIWPRPLNQTSTGRTLYIDQRRFHLCGRPHKSVILEDVLRRYKNAILQAPPTTLPPHATLTRLRRLGGAIQQVKVYMASSDDTLSLHTSEKYTLGVAAPVVEIRAETVYGVLRGLETFSQMTDTVCLDDLAGVTTAHPLGVGADGEIAVDAHAEGSHPRSPFGHERQASESYQRCREGRRVLLVEESAVQDEPRFVHRGLLLDTARHFLPVAIIKQHLDAMLMSKMNVLHWHLVDDQSFPLQSQELPQLSAKGAFRKDLVYSAHDVRGVVEYARARGIRVVPELDTPGHTLSWAGYPDLLTSCYDSRGQPTGTLGPMNPARNGTYALLHILVHEVAALFPEKTLHAGGDEVDFSCWKSNPEVRQWMEDRGWQDYSKAQDFHMRQVLRLAAEAGKSGIIWQEAWRADMTKDTVVQVWKWWADDAALGSGESLGVARTALGSAWGLMAWARDALSPGWWWRQPKLERQGFVEPQPAWAAALQRITAAGFPVVLSAPWYINLGSFAGQDWMQYYAVEPLAFDATPEQAELVLGGEACMWGEYVGATNAITRTWPRAAAVAERLWSPNGGDLDDARLRLKEHRCRMLAWGLPAEPLEPGFCPADSA